MKLSPKLLAAIAVFAIFTFTILVSSRANGVNAIQSTIIPGSLEALAQDALERNLESVTIPTAMWSYAGVTGIDEATTAYSVVIAHPVSRKSYVWNSEFQIIGSWYKFAITENLSQRPFTTCTTCPASPAPPSDLLPLGSNELLIPKFGGSVVVNGVTISSVDETFAEYEMSRSYLLFLKVDASKGVGLTALGPASVFTVSSAGVLSTVAEGADNSLAQDISNRYGNSLTALRAALKP